MLGGSGQLGNAIRKEWPSEIVAPPHAEIDITDAAAVNAAIEDANPNLVVNCAAFHNVDRCEAEPQNAFTANTLAVNALAEFCRERKIRFVTISTDYVFDGTLGRSYRESDAPNPLSAYAASKYAGELLVTRLQADAFVVRTCGLYGTRESEGKGHTFIDRVITQARAGEALRIVSDQIVSTTYAGHLATGLRQLVESDGPPGLYHMVNEGAVSWYDFAREALRVARIDHTIEPISYKDWKSPARRPAYSALENEKLHALGITLPSWREGIQAYVSSRLER